MAEGVEKIIRYKIVIEGDDAKAFVDSLSQGAKVSGGGAAQPKSDKADPLISIADDLDSIRGVVFRLASLLDTIVGQLNMLVDCCDQVGMASYSTAVAIQQIKLPQQPKPKSDPEESGKSVTDMLPRLVALAIGGLGVGAAVAGSATDPLSGFRGIAAIGGQLSAAGGIAGALVGGPWGIAISTATAAVAGLATAALQTAGALLGTANALKEYNGALFASMTAFEYFTMGFKFKLAADVGPALANFVTQIERLMVAMEPLIAETIQALAGALAVIVPLLMRFAQALDVILSAIRYFIASLPVVADYMNLQTGGTYPGTQGDAAAKLVTAMGALLSPLNSIDDQLRQMMGEGQALALWLFTGATKFAHDGRAMGPQPHGVWQSVPDARFTIPEDIGPLARRFFHATTGQGPIAHLAGEHRVDQKDPSAPAPTGGLPRPAPASVSMHIAENAQITPAEDDRLHAELLQWMEAAMGAIRDMNCGRWQRMRVARARVGDWQ